MKRKIKWTAFKESGKYYTEGTALIDPESPYWCNDSLLKDIEETQHSLRKGCISNRIYILVIDGDEDNPNHNYPFVTRLIKRKT